MGRSVFTPHGAVLVLYFDSPVQDSEYDGEWLWNDMKSNIEEALTAESMDFDPADDWVGGEAKVILEDDRMRVALSEYCGLCALSFIPKYEPEEWNDVWEPLQDRYEEICTEYIKLNADRYRKAVAGVVGDIYQRVGGFSNGESVYQKAISNGEAVYERTI